MDKVDENLNRNEEMRNLLESDMFRDAIIDIVAGYIDPRPQSEEKENGSE